MAPIPAQHDLLLALRGTALASEIRTLYVGGAHRFQERALLDSLFPNLKAIYLFEPIQEIVDYLKKVESLDSRVKVFPYALSDVNEERDFFVTNNDGESSSLLRQGRHKEIFPFVHEIGVLRVPCRTLDRLVVEHGLQAPDMLILDVQGAEFQIVSSLSAEIRQRLRAIYVEASLEEVYAGAKCLDDLKAELSRDFDLVGFAALGPSSPTHGNALFLNRSAVGRHAVSSDMPPALSKPVVSVIVSSYAAEAFMRECLGDLQRQTIRDRMEIIVVDAASPEQEGTIVREFQNAHPNITYLRTPFRIGVYAAWNAAIRLARGRYLTSFSTNDRLRPDAYEVLAKALDDHPTVAVVYGDTYVTDTPHQTFEQHNRIGVAQWPDYKYEFLLENCCVGPHPMWRRILHETVGYFDESFVALGDQDFWLRVGAAHDFLHLPVVTGLYWKSVDGLSNRREIIVPELQRLRAAYPRKLP